MSYKIVRHYFNGGSQGEGSFKRTIRTGLTLERAQIHCSDPETSSRTCTKSSGILRFKKYGPWFDSYTEA